MNRTMGLDATDRVACIGSSPRDSTIESSGVLPARRASSTTWSGRIFAFSVTSSPSAIGRAGQAASKAIFAASGSQWMFHSVVGRGVAGDAIRAAHDHPASQQPREVRFALERRGRGSSAGRTSRA
jgi:hypothetical protein